MMKANITEWEQEEKTQLLTEILGAYDTEYVDIHVAGSRVWGNPNEKSDIDVIIWVAIPEIKYRLPRFFFNEFKVSIRIETQPSDGTLYRKCYVGAKCKPEGRDLPTYSLTTNRLYFESENW